MRVTPSALAMADWMVSNPELFRNHTVLELGAGLGLNGLTAPATEIHTPWSPKRSHADAMG